MDLVIELFHSPSMAAILVIVGVWLLTKIDTKPVWVKYGGTFKQAVQLAEKAIPDDPNNKDKALQRFDAALKIVLEVWEKAEKKRADDKTVNAIKQGISIVHAELQKDGALS